MPIYDECGNWAVYPAFRNLKSDQNRWGCCLARSEVGSVSYLEMLQALNEAKCWECDKRVLRTGDDPPTALLNPRCGCYRDWDQQEPGREMGSCASTGRMKVLFESMINGAKGCENCQRRTVESDESSTAFRRYAPRLPEEGNEMIPVDLTQFGKSFRERMKKILEEGAMKVAGDRGLPTELNPPPGQNVAGFLDANAEALVESIRHSRSDGSGNLLSDVAEAFRVDVDELRKYLVVIVNHRRDERISLINVPFNAVELVRRLAEPAADHDISGRLSVWAALADLGRRANAGDYRASEFDEISRVLEVPRTVLVWCAVMYLVKSGEQAALSMPASLPADLAEAFAALDQLHSFKFVEHQATAAVLPEQLDAAAVTEFLTSAAADHAGFANENSTAGLDLPEGTTVRQNLAVLKWLGAGDQEVIDIIVAATGTVLSQATQIYSDIDAEEPPDDEEDKGGGGGGAGGGLGRPQGAGPVGGGSSEGDDDQSIEFIVPGLHIKNASWSELAGHVICDLNPDTRPLPDETCEQILVRLHEKGWPDVAIALLLNRTPAAVTVKLSNIRKDGHLSDPTNPQKAQYAKLGKLSKNILEGQVEPPTNGPNAGVDLTNRVPVGNSPADLLPAAEVLDSPVHDPHYQALVGLAGLCRVNYVPLTSTVRQCLGRIKAVMEPEELDEVLEGVGKLKILPVAELPEIFEVLVTVDPLPDPSQLSPHQIIDIWATTLAELPGLRRSTNTPGVPEVPNDMTLLAYGELLKEKEFTATAIFSVFAGSPLSAEQVAEKLEIKEQEDPPPPPPPGHEAERMEKVRDILNGSADNERMMAVTVDLKWPDIPTDVTLTHYARILKGAKINSELVTSAIFEAYGFSGLCDFSVIQEWYAGLDEIKPSPPPAPPTATTMAVEPPPVTSAQKDVVAGMNRLKAETVAAVFAAHGITIMEFVNECDEYELQQLRSQTEAAHD